MTHEDDHSLLAWLRGKALEAHNNICDANACTKCSFSKACDSSLGGCVAPEFEAAFNMVIAYIEHGRIDQRPHVKERI